MPRRTDIHCILIIGSGPIIIGQACEFDYSGVQACRALKEEGYRVVLINSNPATIMTDPEFADATYVEPITTEAVEKILRRESANGTPIDAVLPTLGGQTALNVAVACYDSGIFTRYGVKMIGADRQAIFRGEDRQAFKDLMISIGLKVPRSVVVHDMEEARRAVADVGLPVIIRPAFTLGGTGGGIAYNIEEFQTIAARGLDASPVHEILIEESVIGWKEYELEVMRDRNDNVVIICSIENIDPMGVHTGDSITVAPVQTLTDKEYQRMRDAAIAIIRAVGVETGGSNIQFAVNPADGEMVVVEMNPRVSRSSALASKATGYPIARIAAKLAVGYTLDELPNFITSRPDRSLWTSACFEPSIDYCVVKMPRWTFEKFPDADETLTTQMKSVGEAMAIGRTFKEALQKAIRSMEVKRFGLGLDRYDKWLNARRQATEGPTAEHVESGMPDSGPRTSDLESQVSGSLPSPCLRGLADPLPPPEDNGPDRTLQGESLDAEWPIPERKLRRKLAVPCQGRLYYIRYALKTGWSIDAVYELTRIDRWFLAQMKQLVDFEDDILAVAHIARRAADGRAAPPSQAELATLERIIRQAKQWGYSDVQLGTAWELPWQAVRRLRTGMGIRPVYKLVDTCAAEFEAATPYYYSTYETPYVDTATEAQTTQSLSRGESRRNEAGDGATGSRSNAGDGLSSTLALSPEPRTLNPQRATERRSDEPTEGRGSAEHQPGCARAAHGDGAEQLESGPPDLRSQIPAPGSQIPDSSSHIPGRFAAARLRGEDSPASSCPRGEDPLAPSHLRGFMQSVASSLRIEDEIRLTDRPKIIIIGGGPNRIGQGIEFDYCCVQAAFAMRDIGFESVMVNSNPETVSTDYDTSDLLFFEPLTHEDILNICERLNGRPFAEPGGLVKGVIVQFGGQTPLNLARGLEEAGVPIIGTSVESIDAAGDREQFRALCQRLGVRQPANGIARNVAEAREVARRIGYPVLVRPSFVLGGRAMEIVSDEDQLNHYMKHAVEAAGTGAETRTENPILIDRFLDNAIEVDVDCVADYGAEPAEGPTTTAPASGESPGKGTTGETANSRTDAHLKPETPRTGPHIPDHFAPSCSGGEDSLAASRLRGSPAPPGRAVICGVMEHIEEAGIHSGDSACALPPYSLPPHIVAALKEQTRSLARALRVRGLMNVQYAIKDGEIHIIEVNPRASRTVPFVSKATGVPWARIAAKVMAGMSLDELGVSELPDPHHTAVKEVVFPFNRFPGVDVILGPEMRSTGETMGIDASFALAYAKAQLGAGTSLPVEGTVFISVRRADKQAIIPAARALADMGFALLATEGTWRAMREHGIEARCLPKLSEGRPNIQDYIKNRQVHLIINTPTRKGPRTDEGRIRAMAVMYRIPMITTITGANAAVQAIAALRAGPWDVRPLQDYFRTSPAGDGR